MSIDHYENFPVASLLCPPELRPAVAAIYHFARTADDLADEGDATAQARMLALRAYRADLHAVEEGRYPSSRWTQVFTPLAAAIQQHNLPTPLLHALLDAFEQDLVKTAYADRTELLHYCERSANPVGRLLLHLYGIADDESLRQSDAICSALQLINFWQDMSRDHPRGRVYAPAADFQRYGLTLEALLACRDSPATQALTQELVDWAEGLMHSGAPLARRIPGRAGWELRFVIQGGLRILERIRAMRFATLDQRPALTALDAPLLAWRALRMRG